MADLFSDRLIEAISQKGSPICAGIDPMPELMPAEVFRDGVYDPADTDGTLDAIYTFTTRVLQIVSKDVPIVKFQSAYFERFHGEGVEAYFSLIHEAKSQGLLVIGDVKRGDIGATSAAYASAHLEDPPFEKDDEVAAPDAITVNPFLGLDTIEPFVEVCRETGKGIFVLVRTSNPGSADFQDVKVADGRTFSEMLADKLAPVAAREGLVGSSGFSTLGAVVGATQPHTMTSLRKRLPQSIFLLPGYGAQGATADMTRSAFVDGRGAIVSASRSLLYAYRDKKYSNSLSDGWERCVERAVADMKAELRGIVGP